MAVSTENTGRHSQALFVLALIKWQLGDYFEAQMHASKSERLARISTGLYREAQAVRVAAMCWYALGDYKKSVFLCNRGGELLRLCGMAKSGLNFSLMNTQAEVHQLKSEYAEARDIYTRTLQSTSPETNPFNHAGALLNIAELDVSLGAPKDDVQSNIEKARNIFSTMGFGTQVTMCDIVLADLYLREGNTHGAKALFKQCIPSSIGHSTQIVSYCLERLGNIRRWDISRPSPTWTAVFLVHSFKFNEKLGVYKAFQFLGDVFLVSDDEDTATSLYTVALEAFTQMDIHRSRAECMLRLGDIAANHSQLLTAVELWENARALFKRSSQGKQVADVDKRLADMKPEVREQYRKNLDSLGG